MPYFIFLKNLDNQFNTLVKIASDENELQGLNLDISNYKIIQDSQNNFNNVKLGISNVEKYNNNTIYFVNGVEYSMNKEILQEYINNIKNQIKEFLNNNQSHPLFSLWNNYLNQLSNLDLNSITYPLNKSLEKYFDDLGQLSYSILQLP
jgi:molybdopterin-guanine dinucleotide biosynthesis protein A